MSKDDSTFNPEIGRMMRQMLFFGDPDGRDAGDRNKKGKQSATREQPQETQLSAHDAGALRDAYLAELERSVTIREGNETRLVPAYVALVKSQLATALKGGAIAQRQALELAERFLAERNRHLDESRKQCQKYITACERQIEDAQRKGQPRPKLIPDPEDIIFAVDGIRIRGPMDEKEDALFQTYPDLLDLLLMLAAYSERFGGYHNGKTPEERTSIASILAIHLNNSLPPRLKPSDASQMMKMMLYDGLARRKLEQMIKAQAQKAGIPRGKARIFPSVRDCLGKDL